MYEYIAAIFSGYLQPLQTKRKTEDNAMTQKW